MAKQRLREGLQEMPFRVAGTPEIKRPVLSHALVQTEAGAGESWIATGLS